MDSFGLPRRHMFGFAAASVLPVGAANAASPPRRALYDLTNPQDQLTAFVKVKGSLDAEDVPHWYFGRFTA